MKLKITLSLLAAILQAVNVFAQTDGGKLVVHEWGTFTSLQGGNGDLISWKPLRTSMLPDFVYNWSNPGLPLLPSSPILIFGKGSVTSLQRLETPVVYFYSDHEQTVDIKVNFPRGMITEWFPEANQIGPSVLNTNAGTSPNFNDGQTPESIIRWSNLQLIPAGGSAASITPLPTSTNGAHYFAARNTDADYVRSSSLTTNLVAGVLEKFLFYRGVGNFNTPLRVSAPSDVEIALTNTGNEILSDLFVLGIKSQAGNFVYVSELQPGEGKTITLTPQAGALNAADLSARISHEMSHALVKAGLYPREAEAMVKTWRDSWFAEDGVRVLYLLPQTWTGRTLPMSLNPPPGELVRVMVGRAEVLTPGMEKSLALQMQKAMQGDDDAAKQARAILKSLGRFAEPAFNRAQAAVKPEPEKRLQLSALLNDARAIQ